jgi:hypothetical protein
MALGLRSAAVYHCSSLLVRLPNVRRHMRSIESSLELRFPGDGRPALVRQELHRACTKFVVSGLADRKFESELTSGSDDGFWASVSEALIYDRLHDKQFPARKKIGAGPDFVIDVEQRRIWIEVICPSPAGVPSHWLDIRPNTVTSMPHEAILLRWTAAIKEKAEKLIGSPDGKVLGYLKAGMVSPADSYVIAVNGCRLRHGPFSALLGISQFPYAAEAVFPIGPYEIHIDRETLKRVGHGHQHRFTIKKPNGASVPTHAFLDARYKHVSAVWAVDFNGCGVLGNAEPSALIHNPYATNPLPRGIVPADDEFIASLISDTELLLERVANDLSERTG